MRLDRGEGPITLVLSRSNLRALLAKLDGHPADTQRMIAGSIVDAPGVLVVAEEDEDHYGSMGRRRGVMHPDTEAAMAGSS